MKLILVSVKMLRLYRKVYVIRANTEGRTKSVKNPLMRTEILCISATSERTPPPPLCKKAKRYQHLNKEMYSRRTIVESINRKLGDDLKQIATEKNRGISLYTSQ